MKAVVQRVLNASVTVEGHLKGSIENGLLVYLGVAHDDTGPDADWLVNKIINLRIFDDSDNIMNLSLEDIINQNGSMVNENSVNQNKIPVNCNKKAGILVISQFTLLGDARKGRRPSWGKAAPPEMARKLYNYFIEKTRESGIVCECGEFQARMMVNYTNEGPVTILLDSKES